jgi:hypothetical protein
MNWERHYFIISFFIFIDDVLLLFGCELTNSSRLENDKGFARGKFEKLE